jgi:hypothetical protein
MVFALDHRVKGLPQRPPTARGALVTDHRRLTL